MKMVSPGRELELVADARRGEDDGLVVLALQALLHDLEVQEPQEAAAEAEAQGEGVVLLVDEGGVVELELLDGHLELVVIGGVHRVDRGEDHRLDLAEAGQGRGAGPLRVGHRIADPHVGDGLDVGDDVADRARGQAVGLGKRYAKLPHSSTTYSESLFMSLIRWPGTMEPPKTRMWTTTPR
jgi:hypothetical protein